jgi:DNA-binding transcriptional ArsR family regulator
VTVPPLEEPPDIELEVSSAAQFKALGHPLRHRLLFALGQRAATISQLAAMLDSGKGNIAHHLAVLREAGLVRVVRTQQVRGGTEQYYLRTARRLRFVGEGTDATTAISLRAVADDIATAAPDPFLVVRNLRLSRAQVEQITAMLHRLADETQDAGDGEPRYGLLLGLYRPRQPD